MTAAKAIVGSAIATLSYFVPVVDDGITASEWLGGLAAAFVAFNAVYWTSNKDEDA